MTTSASLALLGLPDGASDAEVEAAHAELVAYLELAPGALKQWAADELAAADKAYTELVAHTPQATDTATAMPANGHATLKVRSQATDFDALTDGGDLFDGNVDPAPKPPRQRNRTQSKTKAVAVATSSPSRLSPTVRRLALVVGLLGVLAVVAFAGYQLGNPQVPGISGTPAPSGAASQVDLTQVNALMQKITANPQDTKALSDLADLYYAAGDYDTAGLWLDKLIAVDPANVAALLGRGAVAYNTGDNATAERSWRAVLAADDKNVEAHYDLGFMYFTSDPPKTDQARAEWNKVIELVPDSDIASTVRTHLGQLDSLASPGSSPQATPSASPVGGTN